MHQKAGDILKSSPAIPFSENELRMAMDAIKLRVSKGSDLQFGHPAYVADPQAFVAAAKDGFVFMHSDDQLSAGFLFVKLSAGRSLFGKQKAVYASYTETILGDDNWAAGPVFRSWVQAITSIGNIYRAYGFS